MGAIVSTEQSLNILDFEPFLTFLPTFSAVLDPVDPIVYEAEDEAKEFSEPCPENLASVCSFQRRRYPSRLEARMRPRSLPPMDPWEEEADYMGARDWTWWEYRRLRKNWEKGLIEWV